MKQFAVNISFILLIAIIGCGPQNNKVDSSKKANNLKHKQQALRREEIPSTPSPKPNTKPLANDINSSDWFLENHANKVAHFDKSRNIIQIKVLDQRGGNQCGYHSIRNLFYLSALGLAIEQRDSFLIDKLYQELHDVDKFKAFVNALAAIKGCPLTEYHYFFPSKDELIELYNKAPLGFPSSFDKALVISYGIDSRFDFTYYKYPPQEAYESTEYLNFINEYGAELGIFVPLNRKLKEILRYKIRSPYPHEYKMLWGLYEHKLIPFWILLEGSPSHGVAASAFEGRKDNDLTMLFADSYNDTSFLTGWSKYTIDLLYELLKNPKEFLNRLLIAWSYSVFRKEFLNFGITDKSLGKLFELWASDKDKKAQVLEQYDKGLKIFSKYNFEKASLYPAIKEMIDKLGERLRSL